MNEELTAFKETWEASDATKDRTEARSLADAYVAAHPDLEARYGGFGIPDLVALIDAARARGDEERRVEIDLWLLHAFEPQRIGGRRDTSGTRRQQERS